MWQIILAGLACTVLLNIKAFADQPFVPPSINWSGFYVGAQGGYAWQGSRSVGVTGNDDLMQGIVDGTGFFDPSQTPVGLAGLDPKGVNGWLYAGYNWRLGPQWLVGVEADVNLADFRDTGSTSFVLVAPQTGTITVHQEVPWFGTVRGRIGYLPTDYVLLFGTGGLAFGQIKNESTFATSLPMNVSSSDGGAFICPGGGVACFEGASSKTVGGYAVGGGGEFAITPRTSRALISAWCGPG